MRRRPALTVDVGDRGGGPPPAASSPAPPRAVAGVRASVQLSFCDDGRLKLPGGAGGGGAVCQLTEADVRLLAVLGRGASSVVHRGVLLASGTPVAVKRVLAADAGARRQVLRDVAALATPPGTPPPPGLVPLLGAYAEGGGGRVALVLRLMEGGSLADAVAAAAGGGGLPEAVLAAAADGVVTGLNYIHGVKRMVHRDIKPANVLLDADGRALLADFGIAAAVGDGTVAACTTFLGTAAYLAPERARGGSYSFPSDVWGLGLTLLEAATGRYPYDTDGGPLALLLALADDPAPRLPAGDRFSDDLVDFVGRCLVKDPAARATAAALAGHPFLTRWRAARDAAAAPARPPLAAPPRLARVTAARSRSPSPEGEEEEEEGARGCGDRRESPPASARCSSPRVAVAAAAAAPPHSSDVDPAAAAALVRALFAARALPSSSARRAALAPLYDGRAVLTLEGRPPLSGARDVVAALDAAAAGAASLGGRAPTLASIDVLPLPPGGGGGALVLATGTVPGAGPGPLAAAAGGTVRPPRACCDAVTVVSGCARRGEAPRIVAHAHRVQF